MGQIFLFVPLPHSSLFLFLSPPPPAPACRLQRGERPFVSGNCNFSVFDFGQRRKRGDIWYSKLFSFSRTEPVSGVPRSRETSDRADKVTGAKLGPSRPSPLPPSTVCLFLATKILGNSSRQRRGDINFFQKVAPPSPFLTASN